MILTTYRQSKANYYNQFPPLAYIISLRKNIFFLKMSSYFDLTKFSTYFCTKLAAKS